MTINSVNEETWKELDKARIIVNAFKHGEGKSLEEVRKILPEVIYEDDSKSLHSVIEIPEMHFRNLLNTINTFYECVHVETKLDFSNW